MLADTRFLSDDDRKEIANAQTAFESKLRLKARDDSQEFSRQLAALLKGKGRLGYLWAVWADPTEAAVLYALNPEGVGKAQYYGPYTKEQLLDWARSGMAYELRPLQKAA